MNAATHLIENLMQSGADRKTAGRAARVFLSVGLVKLDPCNGSLIVKTAAIYDRENVDHAAGMWRATKHGEAI